MAILHGRDPTQVEQCRVLENGCNEGANPIPPAISEERLEAGIEPSLRALHQAGMLEA
jgi:hypothetical protein